MHAYWRLHITTTQGSSGGVVTIGEIEMRPYPGGPDQCSGGSASADGFYTSSTYGPLAPPNAFDGVNTIGASWVSAVASLPHWIAYQFPAPVDVGEIVIGWPPSYGYPQEQPKNIALQYSDDGSEWATRQSWALAGFSSGEMRALSVGAWASTAGTPRRPAGPATAHHAPAISATLAGTPRRAAGPCAAAHYPPFFVSAAGTPRRPAGSLQAAHTFRPPPRLLRTSYALILTGAEDGTTDIDLPLISWQAVASLDGQTVVQCVVPYSPAIAAQLAARPAGTLRIDQRLHYAVEVLSGTIVSAPWDGAPRTDRGGRSQSITLQGRADAEPSAAKLVRLSGVQYLRIDDSGATVRAAIDFFATPGDALDYGDGTLIASRVTWICTPALSWMEANG